MSIVFKNFLYAQKLLIKDKETKKFIPYVSILNMRSNKWLISDSIGVINFAPKSFQKLKLNALGFIEEDIEFNRDTVIYLSKSNYLLNEVIVKLDLKSENSLIYKTRNNRIKHKYRLYGESHLVNYATLIEFKEKKISLNNVVYNAQIKGDKSVIFVRFKLYKLTENKSIETIVNQRFLNSYQEIYAYDLKDVLPDKNSNFLKFNLPDGIILQKGYYLFSIQVTPTYNEKQRLELNYSSDPFVHTFHRWDWRVHWVPDYFKMAEGYLNLDVKVEYFPLN